MKSEPARQSALSHLRSALSALDVPTVVTGDGRSLPALTDLEAIEVCLIREALRLTEGNQSEAARLLGVRRDKLRYRAKQLRIIKGRWSPNGVYPRRAEP